MQFRVMHSEINSIGMNYFINRFDNYIDHVNVNTSKEEKDKEIPDNCCYLKKRYNFSNMGR